MLNDDSASSFGMHEKYNMAESHLSHRIAGRLTLKNSSKQIAEPLKGI